MPEHEVIVYINEVAKTFTATARKPSARLDEVSDWCAKHGFSAVSVAAQISKAAAEALKKREVRKYEAQGYQYTSRPPL